MDVKVMIRKAERQDVPLLLEFIRDIARFGRMEDEVIASPEVLEDGTVTLYSKDVGLEPRPQMEGTACSIDGRGC